MLHVADSTLLVNLFTTFLPCNKWFIVFAVQKMFISDRPTYLKNETMKKLRSALRVGYHCTLPYSDKVLLSTRSLSS